MSHHILIYGGIIAAALLPHLFAKANDAKNANKDYFMIASCLTSGFLAYCFIMLMSFAQHGRM